METQVIISKKEYDRLISNSDKLYEILKDKGVVYIGVNDEINFGFGTRNDVRLYRESDIVKYLTSELYRVYGERNEIRYKLESLESKSKKRFKLF
jgi:hypothetical protein